MAKQLKKKARKSREENIQQRLNRYILKTIVLKDRFDSLAVELARHINLISFDGVQELLTAYRKLSPENRKQVVAFAKKLHRKQPKLH